MEIRSISYPATPMGTPSERLELNANVPGNAAKPSAPPETPAAVQQPSRSAEAEEVKQAVEDMERMTKLLSRKLEFAMDESGDRAIMRIVDEETKEILRQVPTQEALEIAKAMARIHDMLLVQGSKSTLGR